MMRMAMARTTRAPEERSGPKMGIAKAQTSSSTVIRIADQPMFRSLWESMRYACASMQYLLPNGTPMIDTIAPPRPYVEAYLRNRPLFFTLIRPQEAALFESFRERFEPPILD